MFQAFAQRLYLRIWLAVVGGVAVLTLLVGLAWKVAQEHEVRNLVSREVIADSIETNAGGEYYDGIVGIPGCDKNMPGTIAGWQDLIDHLLWFMVGQLHTVNTMVNH